MTNAQIIQKLRRLHTLLTLQKKSNNLALAIRKAMELIAGWREDADAIVAKTPVRQIFAGYGPKFIKIFEELLRTGEIAMITTLQKDFDPFFCDLCEIPGIGETMARRMFFDKSIRSMDDLRIAYSNDVLQRIPAFGDTRLRAIEDVLWRSQASDWEEDDLNRIAKGDEPTTDATPSRQFELFGRDESDSKRHSSPLRTGEENTATQATEEGKAAGRLFSREHLEAMSDDDTRENARDLRQDSRYDDEFVRSNSILFREPDVTTEGFDPHVDAELRAFIERDLAGNTNAHHDVDGDAERDARSQCVAEADLCVERVQSQTIHATRVCADIIQVRQLRAHSIRTMQDVPEFSPANSVLRENDIHVGSLSAGTIQADILDAESVEAHLVLAALIRMV